MSNFDGRDADLEKLRNTVPRNALEARKIKETGEKIQRERHDGYVRSAREALVKEARRDRWEDIKGISDDLIKHREQGIGRSSFFINLPKGLK